MMLAYRLFTIPLHLKLDFFVKPLCLGENHTRAAQGKKIKKIQNVKL